MQALREYPNIPQLKKLVNHPKIYPEDRVRLRNYLNQVVDSEYVEVEYAKKELNGTAYGRLFPVNGRVYSATYQWRKVRSTLFGKDHYDIDIVNCHPVLLKQLYESGVCGGECPALTNYINNRDKIIEDIHIDPAAIERFNTAQKDDRTKRDLIKTLFTAVIYGGSKDVWMKEYGLEENDFDLKGYYLPFYEEMGRIRREILQIDQEWINELKTDIYEEKGESYEDRKVVSKILQHLECQIVELAMDTFHEICGGKYEVTAYMYDGFMVRDSERQVSERTRGIINELCKQVASKIEDEMGFTIDLIVKPFGEPLEDAEGFITGRLTDPMHEFYFEDFLQMRFDNEVTESQLVQGLIDTVGFVSKGATYVLKTRRDVRLDRVERCGVHFDLYKGRALVNDYDSAVLFTIGDKLIPLSKFICKHMKYLEYIAMDFLPYRMDESPNLDDKVINLFPGFEATPSEDPVDPLILDHFNNVICAGNPLLQTYIRKWQAWLIQRPRVKPKSIPIFYSMNQQVGKNIFWDWFGECVLGKSLYLCTQDLNSVVGNFNSLSKARKLIVLNEADMQGENWHGSANKLKHCGTEEMVTYNEKCKAQVQLHDYAAYMIFSNKPTPAKIETGDKRFVVIEVPDIFQGQPIGDKIKYFNKLADLFADPKQAGAWAGMLMREDLTDWSPTAIPDTDAKKEMVIAQAPSEIMFMLDFTLDNEKVDWVYEELYDAYKQWCIRNGEERRQLRANILGANLRKYELISEKRRARVDGVRQYVVDILPDGVEKWRNKYE